FTVVQATELVFSTPSVLITPPASSFTLSLHAALPILTVPPVIVPVVVSAPVLSTATLPPVSLIPVIVSGLAVFTRLTSPLVVLRSEEHTSELGSRSDVVCRLLV